MEATKQPRRALARLIAFCQQRLSPRRDTRAFRPVEAAILIGAAADIADRIASVLDRRTTRSQRIVGSFCAHREPDGNAGGQLQDVSAHGRHCAGVGDQRTAFQFFVELAIDY